MSPPKVSAVSHRRLADLAISDTTAPSLILLLYFLARCPEHASKIQRELDGVDPTDVRALSALPHLTATIHESMRLLPAVPTFSSRVVGPQGITIDGTFIPGGTKICAPRYSIGRCKQALQYSPRNAGHANFTLVEAAYEQPYSFIPERWYSRPELVKDKRAFAPFGVGKWSLTIILLARNRSAL
jgi:cytochrome P450